MISFSAEEISVIVISLKIATVAAITSLPFGIWFGFILARKNFPLKKLFISFINLPLILPPVVTGYLLLILFGKNGPLGKFLLENFNFTFAFKWTGAVLACAIMGLGILMPVLFENKVGITSASILLGPTFIPITALALLEGQSRYSGSIRVSTAILTSSFSVGQMIGPYFGGVIIDLFNSYSIALTISSISLFIASMLMINPTRFFNRKFRDIL